MHAAVERAEETRALSRARSCRSSSATPRTRTRTGAPPRSRSSSSFRVSTRSSPESAPAARSPAWGRPAPRAAGMPRGRRGARELGRAVGRQARLPQDPGHRRRLLCPRTSTLKSYDDVIAIEDADAAEHARRLARGRVFCRHLVGANCAAAVPRREGAHARARRRDGLLRHRRALPYDRSVPRRGDPDAWPGRGLRLDRRRPRARERVQLERLRAIIRPVPSAVVAFSAASIRRSCCTSRARSSAMRSSR